MPNSMYGSVGGGVGKRQMAVFCETLFYLEQAEVNAAVGAVLYEIGMGGEVVVLAVLKHEETIGGE